MRGVSALATLQARFQAAVLGAPERFTDAIVSTGRVSAEQRVAIYADAYRLRLLEVLEDNYPGLYRLLGTDAFRALGTDYIHAHPSTFRSVRWYGDRLADFITARRDVPAGGLLAEMARVDWTMGLAFDAADADVLEEAAMAAVSPQHWGSLVFTLHPSVFRLDLHHDLPPLREQLRASDDQQDPPARRDAPLPWLFWRRSLRVHYRSLDIDEAHLLDALRRQTPFATLCEMLTEWVDDEHAPMRAVGLLKRWLLDGLISHYHVAEHSAPDARSPTC